MKKNFKQLILFFAGFLMIGFSNSVIAQPDIDVTPLSYDYGEVTIGNYLNHYFTFSNTGTETLHVSNITFTDPAFSIDYTQFTIGPGETGQLPIRFEPVKARYYSDTMMVYSDDPDENPFKVYLYGEGKPPMTDGWEWINTGYDHILVDIDFPNGQNKIGYAVGQKNTYNGEGIVLKTIDGGRTWDKMTPDGTLWLNAMCFLDTLNGFVGGWDGYIMKTTDGGQTWTDINFPYANEANYISVIKFRDKNHGIVGVNVNYGLEPAIYRTTDGGATWIKSTDYSLYHTFSIDYVTDSILVAVGLKDEIARSTDGGKTWSTVYTTANPDDILIGVQFLDEDYGIAVGDHNHGYKTHDGGETWDFANLPEADNIMHSVYIWDKDTAWTVGTPEIVYKTTDGSQSWANVFNGNYQRAFYKIMFTDNYSGFICASQGIVLRKAGFPEIPEAEVTPTSLSFDSVEVGESVVKQITIKNSGYGNLKVSNIVSSNEDFTVDTTSFTVRPRHEQVVNVTFAPSQDSDYTAELTISTNDEENSSITVDLSGTGFVYYPDIDVNPMSLEFGSVTVGETIQQNVTVSNTGDAVLVVSDITSSNAAFSADLTSFDLNPGENKTVVVSFTPADADDYTGDLTIVSNDPDEANVIVSMSGTGVVFYPDIDVNPTEIDFGTVTVGEPAQQNIVVSNNGDAVLSVNDITSSNSAFTVDITSFNVNPGENQTVVVTFSPTEMEAYTGELTIVSNDPVDSNFMVTVIGEGMIYQPVISVDPMELNFDTIVTNEQETKVFTVSNTGNTVLNVSNIYTSNDAFTVDISNFTLDPGASKEVNVTFAPVDPVYYDDVVTVESDDPENSSVEVVVTGYGTIDTYTNEIEGEKSIQIYPNPAKSILYISNAKGKDIKVYDMSGRLVYYMLSENDRISINVSGFNEGLYVVRLTDKNHKEETRKIRIQR